MRWYHEHSRSGWEKERQRGRGREGEERRGEERRGVGYHQSSWGCLLFLETGLISGPCADPPPAHRAHLLPAQLSRPRARIACLARSAPELFAFFFSFLPSFFFFFFWCSPPSSSISWCRAGEGWAKVCTGYWKTHSSCWCCCDNRLLSWTTPRLHRKAHPDRN